MKITKVVTRDVEELEAVQCDGCKKTIAVDDIMELQEMLFLGFTGGFNSVFGDEARMETDLCQECVKRLLGGVLRDVTELNGEE